MLNTNRLGDISPNGSLIFGLYIGSFLKLLNEGFRPHGFAMLTILNSKLITDELHIQTYLQLNLVLTGISHCCC